MLNSKNRLKKRSWCYIYEPRFYDIRCNICHKYNIQWSEYASMIWCYDCEKDVVGDGGLFLGPIPVETTKLMLGEDCLDRIILRNRKVVISVSMNGEVKYFGLKTLSKLKLTKELLQLITIETAY